MAVPDSSARKAPVIEIEYGLAYEFLMTMILVNEETSHDLEVGNEWFDNVRTKAGADLLAAMQMFYVDCNHGWKHLLGLVYESEAPKDVAALLATIEAIDPVELRLHLLGYYRKDFRKKIPLDIMLQAAEGNVEAQEQFIKMSFPDEGDWQGMLRRLFTISPEETKSFILDILQRWYESVFQHYEPLLQPILERDAAAKQALKQNLTPERLIETATNGLAYVPEPGLRRVLLIPSYVNRPWNEISSYQDMMIFWYPVADENVTEDSNSPPVRLVRLYKALADERRLRILKMLMARSYSLQELADEFGVAKTTMHYHLATLRTAGLVLITSNDKEYSLRRNMLSDVSSLLETYLKGKV